jgi:SAM-dependent methyltransferase
MMTTYLLGADSDERRRLLAQGLLYRDDSAQLLDLCGLRPGARALDVGCGPLGVLDLLSERVGPSGRVVGLDNEARMLELARLTIAELGLANVELRLVDAARSGLPPGSFDLVHTRLVLMNVPHSESVVREMVSLTRPGGFVAVEDVDWMSRTCDPGHPSWDRLRDVIAELWAHNGMDVTLGRRLGRHLREAGLIEVQLRARPPMIFRAGHPYHRLLLDRAQLCRDALVKADLISDAELGQLIAEVEHHLATHDTTVIHATLFQAWGRVP